ncbi:MAG: signal transduction histidine kinase [Desulforhopalus sp.]|jgi:signal transduction histidine kinase
MKNLKQTYQKCRQSFQLRIFLALVLIILIFIPGTGYVGYLQALKVEESQMKQYTARTGQQIAKHVSSFLAGHTNNVTLLASLFENKLIPPSNRSKLLQYLTLFKKDHPEFVSIYYGDKNGEFTMVPPQQPEIKNTFDPRTRPWYKGAANSKIPHWTDVYIFASNQKPGITVSVPFFDAEKRLQGVCGIDVDLIAFSKFLQDIDIRNESITYIFENKTGNIIAHPWLTNEPVKYDRLDLLRTIKHQLVSEGKVFGQTDFNNEQFYTSYTPYPDNDWTIGVTVSTSNYLQKIQVIKKTTISLVIAAILLSCVLSYLLTKNIISPLLKLKQGIERITSGDLEYHVQVNSPDIARDLASAFNTMTLSLRKSLIEVKSTYAELQEKQKLAVVGKMTAGIAHEIKNPLGIILGATQVVLDQKRPWEMREKAASFIMDEVVRLDTTLKSFLAFAKPATPVFSEVDVIQLFEETLSATEERYADDGYQILRDFPQAVPLIEADPAQLHQIFLNIFLNAFKAMPNGGTLTIKLRSETEPSIAGSNKRFISIRNPFTVARDWLIISITDEGHGMPREQLENIMDPFVSFNDNGVGLGLSIVSQLVKLHRGHLQVESCPGEGTTFQLYFPCIIKEHTGNVQSTVS